PLRPFGERRLVLGPPRPDGDRVPLGGAGDRRLGRRPIAPRRRLMGVGWDCTAKRRTIKAATCRVVQTAARKWQGPAPRAKRAGNGTHWRRPKGGRRPGGARCHTAAPPAVRACWSHG